LKKQVLTLEDYLINTTIGILGIFDVADKMGFQNMKKKITVKHLADWGVGSRLLFSTYQFLGHLQLEIPPVLLPNVIGGDPWYNASVNGNNEFLSDRCLL
jgi:phospholipid-binding lipoprotein MlaA